MEIQTISGVFMIETKNLGKLFKIPSERRDSLFESMKGLIKSIRYEDVWALRNINFEVKKGEFIGVIGENGSGKTTLLKIIANVLSPTEGYVKTTGRIVPFLELGLGFHDDFTGRENVYLYSQIMGLGKEEIEKRLGFIIKFSGLNKFIDAKLSTYSSGMKVRLAFSTAIQTDPDIFLIDEVLAVGDMKFQQKCFKVFKKFKKEKKTVIFVSHDMGSIKEFCDKVILLKKGKMMMFDEPEYVVAKYISSNIIKEKRLKKAPRLEFRKDKKPDFSRIEDLKKMTNVTWGTKEIEITKVELFDRFDKKNTVFISGEPLKIRIHYRRNKDIKNPVFGLGIFYKDECYLDKKDCFNKKPCFSGKYCFGTNTQLDNYKINEIKKNGHVDCHIKRLNMWEGDFYLNITVHNNKYYHYDWHNKRYEFKVKKLNKKHDQGLFNLECNWEVS